MTLVCLAYVQSFSCSQSLLDNIAPPVASCLGDLVTLLLIGATSTVLIGFIHTPLPLIVGLCVVGIATTCFFLTRRNTYVRELVKEGWSPLFGAMVISSCTGIVLDLFVSRYEGFALLAVVISGRILFQTLAEKCSLRVHRSSW